VGARGVWLIGGGLLRDTCHDDVALSFEGGNLVSEAAFDDETM